ncbi:MAG: hypothetical protein OJJ21_16875 [Ferrovibrio sp.]|uniref:hypothetical protein n=1 Tax=Ferrovibrio sp. TaxID=1917215 RepID=UPI00260BA9A9|nr:hypothetical protein [Ferrovibrio sp.]MCW0235275.1 hypothetical protein [Ferrovibrio sp.]
MFYTYIWRDSAGLPFYVGKGGNDNGKRSRNVSMRSKEFKAIHANGGCTVEMVDEFILESQAFAHECELIERYGRADRLEGCLVNQTDGGDGASGATRSQDARGKIAASKIGKPRPQWLKDHLSLLKSGVKLSRNTARPYPLA